MMAARQPANEFHALLVAVIPRLRLQAYSLTRDRDAADDLVQDTICNALTAQDRFEPGTNFNAWMAVVLRNRFISNLRRARPTSDIENVPEEYLAAPPRQENVVRAHEVGRTMAALTPTMVHALNAIVMDGMSYETLAATTGVEVGTAKSRVFRARLILRDGIPQQAARVP